MDNQISCVLGKNEAVHGKLSFLDVLWIVLWHCTEDQSCLVSFEEVQKKSSTRINRSFIGLAWFHLGQLLWASDFHCNWLQFNLLTVKQNQPFLFYLGNAQTAGFYLDPHCCCNATRSNCNMTESNNLWMYILSNLILLPIKFHKTTEQPHTAWLSLLSMPHCSCQEAGYHGHPFYGVFGAFRDWP